MPDDIPSDEMRMRAALGLHRDPRQRPVSHRPEQSQQRRRFVREGEVAVTMINSATAATSLMEAPRSRLIALEEALTTERSSLARTKRALDDALAANKALETKHVHTELAHAEAIENERSARAQTEAALQQLQAQLHEMEERFRQLESAAASQPPQTKRTAGPIARAGRRSKEASDAVEAEPVQWWLPNRQAGKRRR